VHRAAAVVERTYWAEVVVDEIYGGGGVGKGGGGGELSLKKGCITSLAPSPGTALCVAAGTSDGEIVVWKFPGGEEATSGTGGAPEGDTHPFVIARAKCAPHPDADKPPKKAAAVAKDGSGPTKAAAHAAVVALGWSADASQLASAERGGVSRLWTVGTAGSKSRAGGTGARKAESAKSAKGGTEAGAVTEMAAVMVLAPVNHSSSSPLPDATPPALENGNDFDGKVAAGSVATGAAADAVSKPKTSRQLLKEKAASAKAATEAAAAKVATRERWADDSLLLTSFFPAFTIGGRQPYAVFTRPNGDIVRAAPSPNPTAISEDLRLGPVRGRTAREVAMFRGAQSWARGDALNFAAVVQPGSVPDVRRTRSLPGYASRDMDAIETNEGGDVGAGADGVGGHDDLDVVDEFRDVDPSEPFAALAGSERVIGVDRLLDAAERFFGAGAGGFMSKAEKRLLLAPQVAPTTPPGKAAKAGANATIIEHPPDVYTQDVYRGHTSPVVFLNTLPDSASMISIDVGGTVCMWAAFQGDRSRSGFGWFSPLGTWMLPREVTAQVPAGPRVQLVPTLDAKGKRAKGTAHDPGATASEEVAGASGTSGLSSERADRDVSKSHAPWLVSYGLSAGEDADKKSKRGSTAAARTVVEIPKDHDWMAADEEAADAAALLSPRSKVGDTMAVERLGVMSGLARGAQSGGIGRRSGVVIPPKEIRDYFISCYDDAGALSTRHRQRHVTRRAAATVVGACIIADSGQPDLLVIRRVSGLAAAALQAGGIDAATSAVPYFTAHCYSLDSMTPTVPRMDLPNPFAAPAGKGPAATAKARGEKPRKNALSAGEEAREAARGWADPAPYPFVLASATPSLGSEHLIVPVGAAHIGIFSLATGLMAHDLELPGIPPGERLAVMALTANPGSNSAGAGSGELGAMAIRSLLVVATAGGKDGGKAVRVYALNEGAAQIVRVDASRAEVARSLPPPGDYDDTDSDEEESVADVENSHIEGDAAGTDAVSTILSNLRAAEKKKDMEGEANEDSDSDGSESESGVENDEVEPERRT